MILKRFFDFFFSTLALVFLSWILFLCYIISSIDTNSNGFFFQKRVGQFGKLFTIYKLKTIHPKSGRISKTGLFFRKYKLDELPQLINVLKGEMSIVGPRPDIEGYYDKLEKENRKILELKPGITCEASIKYFDEEEILSKQLNPLLYNDKIIFPDKIKINLDYYYKRTFLVDLKIIFKTFIRKKY